MLIVHVPEDPVMTNKKYPLNKEKSVDGLVKKIKKLSTSSVISGTESCDFIFQVQIHMTLYFRYRVL